MNKSLSLKSLTLVHPNAAGLDIGSREIWAAVRPDLDGETMRCFATFTPDLEALADWLLAGGVDTVAMESTGVYWIPIFELLEARGIQCYLVNARHVKHVPGRKSDVQDCQWLQKLHSLGLLSASFVPTPRCAPCARSSAIAPNSSSTAPPTSSICRKRFNK